jgi:RimJ/RimL family protein N-acetyltransferase
MGRSAPLEPPGAPLTDGVVALRRRRAGDLDAIVAASHDPETVRWLDDPPMDEAARRTSMDRVARAWQTGQGAALVVADAETDEPVGMVNLQFRNDEVATVAYGVFPGNRGRGIAPRAVRLLAEWAFGDLKLTELLLESDEANAASIRVAEKCGFRPVGTRPEPGTGPADAQRTMLIFARRGSAPEEADHAL